MNKQRWEYLDFFKGFYIFFVCAGNITQMNGTFWMVPDYIPMGDLSWIDSISAKLLHYFFVPELNVMFTMIYGHNIYLWMSRGFSVGDFFKRTITLMSFGLIHAAFFYWGDILFIHGVISVGLLFLIKTTSRFDIKLFIILCLYLISSDIYLTFFHKETFVSSISVNEHLKYGSLPFWDLVVYRFKDFYAFNFYRMFNWESSKYTLITFNAMITFFTVMVFGVILGKCRLFEKLEKNSSYKSIFVMTIFFLFGQYLIYLYPSFKGSSYHFRIFFNIFFVILIINEVYYRLTPNWIKRFVILSGKNTLTIYIGGNILGAWLLSAYGLGLYQKIGPFVLFLSGAILYFLLTFLSMRFGFLPLEILWRGIVYAKK